MTIVIGVGVAFALLIGYVRLVARMREARRTRFVFLDRDTYLLLRLDHALGSDEAAVVAMRALREALRLKLAAPRYERLLVDVSRLRMAGTNAFWLLMGALGPALRDEGVKLAVVCAPRAPAARLFEQAGILSPLRSERDAERYLASAEPRQAVRFDPGETDELLVDARRKAA